MSVYKQTYLKLFNSITDIVEHFNTMSEEMAEKYRLLEETQQLAEDMYIESDAIELNDNDIYRKPYLHLFNAITDIMKTMSETDCIIQTEYIKLIETQQKAEELYLLNGDEQTVKLLMLYEQCKDKIFNYKPVETESIITTEQDIDS